MKNVSDDIVRRQIKYTHSCDVVGMSGEYTINYNSLPYGMNVYCDVDSNNKGWIVIQRRIDGSVDFERPWSDYRAGFGNVNGNFWLGNEQIYQLTKDEPRELRIDMETFDGTKRYAQYSKFTVSSEAEKYKLHVSGYTGNAGDDLTTKTIGFNNFIHNGQSFSTIDADNDQYTRCCACTYGGGWWYTNCFTVNLNGKYFKERETVPFRQGINWYSFTGDSTSLKFVQMSIH